jgi:hypothetical protein
MAEPNEPVLNYSLKQYVVVRKVLKSDNHFRILGVTRQASLNTIKRQWKRLSRLVHPDKNAAPGAEEAFKRVNNAYGVLSDPLQRQHYEAVYTKLRTLRSKKEPKHRKTTLWISSFRIFVILQMIPFILLVLFAFRFFMFENSSPLLETSHVTNNSSLLVMTCEKYSDPHSYLVFSKTLAHTHYEHEQQKITTQEIGLRYVPVCSDQNFVAETNQRSKQP